MCEGPSISFDRLSNENEGGGRFPTFPFSTFSNPLTVLEDFLTFLESMAPPGDKHSFYQWFSMTFQDHFSWIFLSFHGISQLFNFSASFLIF